MVVFIHYLPPIDLNCQIFPRKEYDPIRLEVLPCGSQFPCTAEPTTGYPSVLIHLWCSIRDYNAHILPGSKARAAALAAARRAASNAAPAQREKAVADAAAAAAAVSFKYTLELSSLDAWTLYTMQSKRSFVASGMGPWMETQGLFISYADIPTFKFLLNIPPPRSPTKLAV